MRAGRPASVCDASAFQKREPSPLSPLTILLPHQPGRLMTREKDGYQFPRHTECLCLLINGTEFLGILCHFTALPLIAYFSIPTGIQYSITLQYFFTPHSDTPRGRRTRPRQEISLCRLNSNYAKQNRSTGRHSVLPGKPSEVLTVGKRMRGLSGF